MHTLIEVLRGQPSFRVVGLFYAPAIFTAPDEATAKRHWFDTRGGGQSAIWKVEAA